MEPLRFTCSKITNTVDFRIVYWNPGHWNDYGYYTRYKLIAEKSITGGDPITLGLIKASSIKQEAGEVDCLHRIMGDLIFEKIDESCFVVIFDEEIAKKLFVLLNPEQRQNFMDALNMKILFDTEVFLRAIKHDAIFGGLFRRECAAETIQKKRDIVEKYMFSKIDYHSLPKL